MNQKMVLAIVVIVIIAGAAGLYVITQPVPNPYKVAIVFATGGLGDKSFNDGCYAGALKASQDFNFKFTYVQPAAIADYEGYIRQYASHVGYINPYELIICIGYDQAAALEEVALEYPNQRFAIVDMVLNTTIYSNVTGLVFAENEGSALVGAMAGLYTRTNKLGFVGGMDIPLINKFLAGYAFGANLTNPAVNVTARYTNNFGDPSTGKTATEALIDVEGCDIIFAAAGRSGLGAIQSVVEKNGTKAYPLWAIGVDSPQMWLGFEDPANPSGYSVVLTSMLKRVDVAVYDIIKDVLVDDDFAGGVKVYNMANNGVGYEVNATLLPIRQEVLDIVEDIKQGIINGSIVVPTAPWW